MAWTRYRMLLVTIMVVTGSFSILSIEYADRIIVPGLDGQPRIFNHPFMQSSFMFLGDGLCLVVFEITFCYFNRRSDGSSSETSALAKGSRTFNPLVMLIPACCDMIATSCMYVGLRLTYASSFLMLQGTVIIFTAILSMEFLNRKLGSREWFGISLVIVGLGLVGVSDIMKIDFDVNINSILIGNLLIICAQVIRAVQMVAEEKFVSSQDIPPLQAVGWEGLFGFIGVALLIIPLNFIPGNPPFADNSRGTLEATLDAFVQIGNSGRLLMVGNTLSIAFFNFAGLSITKKLSATTRMILDSVRTIVIWAFSLAFGWQKFHYLQLIGFTVLPVGTSCYNNFIIPQLVRKGQSRLGWDRAPRQIDQTHILKKEYIPNGLYYVNNR